MFVFLSAGPDLALPVDHDLPHLVGPGLEVHAELVLLLLKGPGK